ncbi:TPA: branched-chain amino acid ABC transporter permease [Candidatus Poribacteria bacterium]|jgi:branched-chain amino acid transport system permease protein|nr:branched-chain amino acid ABC transporter permease [Candidatus Poribacteria bacterium]
MAGSRIREIGIKKARLFAFIVIIAFLLLPFIYPRVLIMRTLNTTFIYAVCAIGWALVGGYTGLFSLGHSAFFGLGAYCLAWLYLAYGVHPIIGILLGIGSSVILACGIALISARLRGVYFALSTIGILLVLMYVMRTFTYFEWRGAPSGGGIGVPVAPELMLPLSTSYLLSFGIVLLGTYFLYKVEKSKFGHYLIAIREDEDVAASLGVPVLKYKTIATIISSVFATIGGFIFASSTFHLNPDLTFSLDRSIDMLIIAVLGGSGTFIGPFVGALIWAPLIEYVRWNWGATYIGLPKILSGTVLLLIFLISPTGIVPPIQRKFLKRKKHGMIKNA